jgi:ferredoxin-like protein FixX
MNKTTEISDFTARLASHGLIPRGIILFEQNDARPYLSSAKPALELVLIGHKGPSIWPHFKAWRQAQKHLGSNPLDDWSKSVIRPIAAQLGGEAVFPSDMPYHPFQQWAMRAEGLKPSPLGMLIHPTYGTWHAYRGAILFDKLTLGQFLEKLNQPLQKLSHPCDTCIEKPCLTACPVSAFSDDGFAVTRCRAYLESTEGRSCMNNGCKARGACPVGVDYKYSTEQLHFHMKAFAK